MNQKKKLQINFQIFIIFALVVSMLTPFSAQTNANGVANDLIISEYIEGSSNNKAIEIFNGTGATVDLSQYTVELYTNGATTVGNKHTFPADTILPNGKTYVLYNSSSVQALKDLGNSVSSAINFNGDDAIVLKKGEIIIDSFGQVGVDPGTEWAANGVSSVNKTLVRKSSVISGDTTTGDAFDPSVEWFALATIDDFSHIGTHTMDNFTSPAETQVASVKASVASGTVLASTTVTLTTATPDAQIYYSTDGYDPTTASTLYSGPITINEAATIKAFAVKDGLEASSISTYAYTIQAPLTVVSIADARAQATGEVAVKGIITAKLNNTAHIQDSTGAIAIYKTSNITANVGDEITVKGILDAYYGLMQLKTPTVLNTTPSVGVPAPTVLTVDNLNEANESKLATIKNVMISGTAPNYTGTDEAGKTFTVRDEKSSLGLLPDSKYVSVTGIVQEFDGTWQIIPRSKEDIVIDATFLKAAMANPSTGIYTSTQNVTLSTTTANAEIFYTLDGTEPTDASTKYTAPVAIDKTTTLKAIVKAQDGAFSSVSSINYKIQDEIRIADIQGAGHYSPMKDQTVSGIEGVVTFIDANNIWMQDLQPDNDPKTSEGILVYKTSHGLNVGDVISVSGKVQEYFLDGYDDKAKTDLPVTQISATAISTISTGQELPEPFKINENRPIQNIDNDNLTSFDPEEDAIDYWESLEGMRVQVGNVKAVAPQEYGDLITLLENEATNSLHGGVLFEEGKPNAHRIQFRMLPNDAAKNFEVATGDKFNGPITGIMGYSYSNYKILVSLDTMKAAFVEGTAKPEVTKIVKAEDKLTIASYNLENFSANTAETSNDKAQKLARAIVQDMNQPDIVGLTEVQDNNGEGTGVTAADQSYQRLINAIVAAGGPTYQYLNIDPEAGKDGGAPNANIRVGFLYNPARVSLPAGLAAGDATTAVGYENGQLTHNPGRIDPTNAAFNSSRKPLAAQFTFKGKDIIVIANHWNSKGGDKPLFGAQQPPTYGSETQRKQIAQVVYNFISDVKTKNPDANIVSLGDFNDFQFTDALKIHEGTLMTNMINKAEASDRYTYLYQGNSQVLDHILVSKNLEEKTVIDILHINADFTEMAGRASDHDPVMVQIDLSSAAVKPVVAEKVYNLNNFKSRSLVIAKPSVSVTLNGNTVIPNGILFKGQYVELHGEGFATQNVTIKPNKAGAIIDLKGTKVQKLIIDGPNVKEIRGAENATIEFINGAVKENITITTTGGSPIGDSSLLFIDHPEFVSQICN